MMCASQRWTKFSKVFKRCKSPKKDVAKKRKTVGNSILFSIIELIRRLILPSVGISRNARAHTRFTHPATPTLTPAPPPHRALTLQDVPRYNLGGRLAHFGGKVRTGPAASRRGGRQHVGQTPGQAPHGPEKEARAQAQQPLRPGFHRQRGGWRGRRRRGASRGGGHSHGRGSTHAARYQTPRRRRRRRLIRREDRHQRRGTGPGDVRGHAGHRGVTRGVQKAARVRVAL